MNIRRLLLASMALMAMVAALAVASSTRAAVVAGSGTLAASGTGVAVVHGAINYQATAGPRSVLLVKDVAGDASISVTGASGHAPYGGATAYFDFTGATISGTEVGVAAVGTDLSLTVSGRGWAYLKGTGTYSVDGGPSQNWDPAGRLAAFRGRGTLTATGTGVAGVRGLLDYQATAGAGAILLVKDVAGDATINVTGATGQAPFLGFTAYFGFTGATITGTEVVAMAIGPNLNIDVSGRGGAYLKGTGTYSINGGPSQPWRNDGGFAVIDAPGT